MADQPYELFIPHSRSGNVQEIIVPSTAGFTFRLSSLLLAFLTIIDALLFTYLIAHYPVYAELAVDDLGNHDTFAKFSRLYQGKLSPKTIYEPIKNYPQSLAHISSMGLDMVVASADDQHHLRVSEHISTIAQFHVLDSGMENCTFMLLFDEATTTDTIRPPMALDAWKLHMDKEITSSQISWDTKPPRDYLVGSITAEAGVTYQLPGFACPSGSYQTFEVTCSQPHCGVTTTTRWEDGRLYLVQSQAV
ncbi:hypothetical protein BDN72DRAFT_486683 [Pluteus cervinus]|uniref:Uncharacterized protein n=1 Tax=Pluteus cervinus TaxID=181527 RepID=A0ACD3AZL9_9AGAR|nr:hypothetical protein BDN72DRAFT_486683 [Pluteus cervinus]